MQRKMILANIMTGSSGNSTIIKSGDTEIMIDAGGSFKKISEKYKELFKKDFTKLDAIFVSHEHSDHISGAGIIGRKLNSIIYLPEKCYEKKKDLFKSCVVNYFKGGDTVEVGNLIIRAFSTRHDSEDSVGFVVIEKQTNLKVACLTDTGSIGKLIKDSISDCNAYMIEADYDDDSLTKYAEYDDILKERIRSNYGHLSNQQALEYIDTSIDLNKVQWILFSHMSERTNSPDLLENQIKSKFPSGYWDKFHIAKHALELEIKDKPTECST